MSAGGFIKEASCIVLIVLEVLLGMAVMVIFTTYANSIEQVPVEQQTIGIVLAAISGVVLFVIHPVFFIIYLIKNRRKEKEDSSAFSDYSERGEINADAVPQRRLRKNTRTIEDRQKKWGIPIVASALLVLEEGSIDNQCQICKLPLKNRKGEIVQCKNCESFFHEEHLKKWLEEYTTCPVCNCVLLRKISAQNT